MVLKKTLAAFLAGIIAVGSLSVSAYTVKADEAVATDTDVIEVTDVEEVDEADEVVEVEEVFETAEEIDENTVRLEDVTKFDFKKDAQEDQIVFCRTLKVSLDALVKDVTKAMKQGKGISWINNTVIILTDSKGKVFTIRNTSDKGVKVTAVDEKGKDYTGDTTVRSFKKSVVKITNKKEVTIGDIFTALAALQANTKLSQEYIYGGTKIQSIVVQKDGTYAAKIDNQKYTFFVHKNVLYAKGDVTKYKAVKTWENRGIVMAIYIPESKINVYRIYNPNSGEHFYTTNKDEADKAVKSGWNDEGRPCMAPKDSEEPVYRLFNPNARDAGSHHFTISEAERDSLVKAGWIDEGIAFYSASRSAGVKLWRSYNKNDGGHNFTINIQEHKSVVKAGWKDEGLAWYVYPLS